MNAGFARAALVAALVVLASPAVAAEPGARAQGRAIMSEDPAGARLEQEWGFSDALVVGDTVYLSGVVAGVREGETDLQAAYTRAFDRIGAILERAGASWGDVVDLTTFHTDLTTQMPAIVAVKSRYVKAPFPAWTAIQVARLIPNAGITEIKVVARLRR